MLSKGVVLPSIITTFGKALGSCLTADFRSSRAGPCSSDEPDAARAEQPSDHAAADSCAGGQGGECGAGAKATGKGEAESPDLQDRHGPGGL